MRILVLVCKPLFQRSKERKAICCFILLFATRAFSNPNGSFPSRLSPVDSPRMPGTTLHSGSLPEFSLPCPGARVRIHWVYCVKIRSGPSHLRIAYSYVAGVLSCAFPGFATQTSPTTANAEMNRIFLIYSPLFFPNLCITKRDFTHGHTLTSGLRVASLYQRQGGRIRLISGRNRAQVASSALRTLVLQQTKTNHL